MNTLYINPSASKKQPLSQARILTAFPKILHQYPAPKPESEFLLDVFLIILKPPLVLPIKSKINANIENSRTEQEQTP